MEFNKAPYSEDDLLKLVVRQVSALYPVSPDEERLIELAIDRALARCEVSFSHNRNKYYSSGGSVRFDPLHGCQWAAFLYFLSNTIFKMKEDPVCDKIYALNKALSSADLYYQVELPDIFAFDHPLGAVMGRASYSNYFSFSQGCTVGNNHGIYPRFGESVFMMSDSKVIGDCSIGDYVIIGANAYVKDTDIPSGSIVFGQSPELTIKEGRLEYVKEYANDVFDYEESS